MAPFEVEELLVTVLPYEAAGGPCKPRTPNTPCPNDQMPTCGWESKPCKPPSDICPDRSQHPCHLPTKAGPGGQTNAAADDLTALQAQLHIVLETTTAPT